MPQWTDLSDPWTLGKSRGLVDPSFRAAPDNWPAEELEAEIKEVEENPKTKKLRLARAFIAGLEYGHTSPWPPLDPGMCLSDFQTHMEEQYQQVIARWKRQAVFLTRKGPRILQLLEQIEDGEFPNVDLPSMLRTIWRKTRNDYNRDHAVEPNGVLPGFRLDPNGEIPAAHGCDLDNFVLDFVDDIVDSKDAIHTPIYRNGVNYKDDSDAIKRVRAGEEGAWEELKLPPKIVQGNIAYNMGVREHLERVRASYLVPHINLEDLSNLNYLGKFIMSRGAAEPLLSAVVDNDLMYLGMSSRILSGPYSHYSPISFFVGDDKSSGESHFFIKIWKREELENPDYDQQSRRGNVWGTMEAWLVMQAGILDSLFLYHLYSEVLGIGHEEIPDDFDQTVLTKSDLLEANGRMMFQFEQIQDARGYGFANEGWQDLASLRQYEQKQRFASLHRYMSAITTKMERATDHMHHLFEDPDYFAEVMIEQKDHHWSNLTVDYREDRSKHIEKYDNIKLRHELYHDCLRRVLRRGVFGHFIWKLLRQKMVAYQDRARQLMTKVAVTTGKEDPQWRDEPGEGTRLYNSRFKRHDAVISALAGDEEHTILQHELITTVRYCAILFLREFQSGLMHAASEPIRDHYSRISQPTDYLPIDPNKPEKCPFPKGLYNGPDYRAKPTRTTLHIDHDDLPRLVGELINNFIANNSASLYVGVRKVTERLRRYLDDCDDEESSRAFTDLVADTLDSLDTLVEIAQHLDDCWPLQSQDALMLTDDELLNRTSKYCISESIDLVAFDEFPFEIKGIPEKRIERIFRFLDEVQGFSPSIITYGEARGDLKRLGASMLKNFIIPQNESARHKGTPQAIQTLEMVMGTFRNEFPFNEKEKPVDLDAQEKIPRRKPSDRWRGEAKRIKKDNKKRIDARRKRLAAEDKSFAQAVSDQDRRLKMMEQRQQRELERWRRVAQKRRKAKWNARAQGQREPQPVVDDEMEVDVEGDLVGPMEGLLNVQAQPLMPPPAVQEPTRPPPRPLAPGDPMGPPPRPVPRQQPLPQAPQPRAPPPQANAPDGKPRALLHKNTWATLQSIYGVQATKVTWSDLVKAMNTLGYRDEGRGGSHGVFTWTEGCRWPQEVLGKGRNIQLAKNHEGERKGAPRGKTKNWGFRLGERGITWDFVRQWYHQK